MLMLLMKVLLGKSGTARRFFFCIISKRVGSVFFRFREAIIVFHLVAFLQVLVSRQDKRCADGQPYKGPDQEKGRNLHGNCMVTFKAHVAESAAK